MRQLRSGSRGSAAASTTRQFSAAPAEQAAGDDDDIVIQAFKEQTKQYKQISEAAKNVQVPIDGDADAIKKYADEMQRIKKQAGALDPVEVANAKMDFDLECAGFNVRKFLGLFAIQRDTLGEFGNTVLNEVTAAVDEVEQKTDAILDGDNEEGWSLFQQKIGEIGKKHNLDDLEKIKEQSVVEQYTDSINDLRTSAVEEMEAAKRKDGLEWVKVDLSQLKPKLT